MAGWQMAKCGLPKRKAVMRNRFQMYREINQVYPSPGIILIYICDRQTEANAREAVSGLNSNV